jgi:hypothetical protein
MKRLVPFFALLALLFSCHEELKNASTRRQPLLQLNQYKEKFNALSFRSFADFRAVVNSSTSDFTKYRPTPGTAFQSLTSLLVRARAMASEVKDDPAARSAVKAQIESLSLQTWLRR